MLIHGNGFLIVSQVIGTRLELTVSISRVPPFPNLIAEVEKVQKATDSVINDDKRREQDKHPPPLSDIRLSSLLLHRDMACESRADILLGHPNAVVRPNVR
jgi:hypothetical protein